jgi:hypothetical protein
MMMSLFLALIVPGAGTATGPDWPTRVATACHIAPDRLAMRRVGDDFDVLRVEGSAPLSDAQIRCYSEQLTAEGAPYPAFEDDQLGQRYSELAEADQIADDRKQRREARVYLGQRGLLHLLPRYDRRHERLAAFAVRLERLCRARPHSALEAIHGNIQISQAALNGPTAHFDRVDCAMRAAIASGYQVFGARVSMPPPVAVVLPAPEIETNLELPGAKPM